MPVAAEYADAAGAPVEFHGVVTEPVVMFVTTFMAVVPHRQAVVAVVAHGAVIHRRVACGAAEVESVGNIVAQAAVDDAYVVAQLEPCATLKVLYPQVVGEESVRPALQAFVVGLLMMARVETGVQMYA